MSVFEPVGRSERVGSIQNREVGQREGAHASGAPCGWSGRDLAGRSARSRAEPERRLRDLLGPHRACWDFAYRHERHAISVTSKVCHLIEIGGRSRREYQAAVSEKAVVTCWNQTLRTSVRPALRVSCDAGWNQSTAIRNIFSACRDGCGRSRTLTDKRPSQATKMGSCGLPRHQTCS